MSSCTKFVKNCIFIGRLPASTSPPHLGWEECRRWTPVSYHLRWFMSSQHQRRRDGTGFLRVMHRVFGRRMPATSAPRTPAGARRKSARRGVFFGQKGVLFEVIKFIEIVYWFFWWTLASWYFFSGIFFVNGAFQRIFELSCFGMGFLENTWRHQT